MKITLLCLKAKMYEKYDKIRKNIYVLIWKILYCPPEI